MAHYGKSEEESALCGEEAASENWFTRWLKNQRQEAEALKKYPPGHPALAVYEKTRRKTWEV